jgi:hypothetical protein
MGLIDSDEPISQDELARRQAREQEHMTNQQAAGQNDVVDPGYVEQMLDDDLDDETGQLMANMLSQDWILSQMTEAETHEARWLARVIMKEIETIHPPEDSIWSGEIRAYASNDEDQGSLEPLSSADKSAIFQFIQGYIARVLRSREGMQQEMFRKTIRKSEREDRTADENEGWL